MAEKQARDRVIDTLAALSATRSQLTRSMRQSRRSAFEGWGSINTNFLVPSRSRTEPAAKQPSAHAIQLPATIQPRKGASNSTGRCHLPAINNAQERYKKQYEASKTGKASDNGYEVQTNMIRQSQNIPLRALVRYTKTPVNISFVNMLSLELDQSQLGKRNMVPHVPRNRKHSLLDKLVRDRRKRI